MSKFLQRQELAAMALLRAGALQFGDFTLASGKKSPYYVNCRLLQSFPRELGEVATAMMQMMSEKGLSEVDLIAGLPEAAVPLATVISQMTGVPMITPRKKPKDHGVGGQIDGVYKVGQRVGMVDDVVTTAGTKLEFAAILEEAELKVSTIWIVVDRLYNGVQAITEAGYSCDALVTILDLVEIYRSKRAIEEAKLQAIEGFVASELVDLQKRE